MVYKKIVEMTRNDVKKAFTKIYAADYCSLECLLKNQLRIGTTLVLLVGIMMFFP